MVIYRLIIATARLTGGLGVILVAITRFAMAGRRLIGVFAPTR